VLALTPKRDTARRISLAWGVHAVVTRDANDADDMTFRACKFAVRAGLAKVGERIIVIAGVPFGTPGATNMIRIAFVSGAKLPRMPPSISSRPASGARVRAKSGARHRRGGEVVVPRDTAGPGMRHRRDEDEAGDEIGMVQREAGGDDAGERVGDDHHALDADPCHGLADEGGLPRRRTVGPPARPVAPAVARPVDGDEMVPVAETRGERQRHVGGVPGCAVDEQDGGDAGRDGRRALDDVKPAASDGQEPALGRMRTLDAVNQHLRGDRKQQDDSADGENPGHGRAEYEGLAGHGIRHDGNIAAREPSRRVLPTSGFRCRGLRNRARGAPRRT
jgi:hypothetical protein